MSKATHERRKAAGSPRRALRVKRVYEPPTPDDGARVLVDRLWPRGLKKADLALAAWWKDLAPSAELRGWFHHEPDRWEEFERRYLEELERQRSIVLASLDALPSGEVTLLFAAKDEQRNNAVVLRGFLAGGAG